MRLRLDRLSRRRGHSGQHLLVISPVDMEADERPLVLTGKVHSSVSLLVDDDVGISRL